MTICRLMPDEGNTPQALILVLHGVGADPASMRPVARVLHDANPQAADVTPDAPLPFDLGGRPYQWFSIRGVDDNNRQTRIADATNFRSSINRTDVARNCLAFAGRL
jgi:phospholipase/carboxylesterase